jgi:hypothetical protein
MENTTPQHRAVRRELIKIHDDWLRQLSSVRSSDCPHQNDFIYESCRLTALLQMNMLEDHSVMDTRQLLTQLKEALKKTELAKCWGNMVSVFWWILMSKSDWHLGISVALITSIVAIPLSHDIPDSKFFHIQCSRVVENICMPSKLQYHAAVRSAREYFRFREACRLGRG